MPPFLKIRAILPIALIALFLLAILQAFAAHLDAQPGPVQVTFQYALARLMVEAGRAETRGSQ